MKILVIEDEKMLADSIKAMLQRNGFQVECVYDGETGKEYAELGIYDLLILDEPTAAMDVETTALAEKRIRSYVRETGCALVLVTHSLRQARRLADEVLFFHEGKLIESGAGVLSRPEQPQTRQFLDFYGV